MRARPEGRVSLCLHHPSFCNASLLCSSTSLSHSSSLICGPPLDPAPFSSYRSCLRADQSLTMGHPIALTFWPLLMVSNFNCLCGSEGGTASLTGLRVIALPWLGNDRVHACLPHTRLLRLLSPLFRSAFSWCGDMMKTLVLESVAGHHTRPTPCRAIGDPEGDEQWSHNGTAGEQLKEGCP